ncbi:MAG: hypothetical protein KKA42_04905 [candidate division Zixibacteria bacterium]|nr:hypothetical protein [candidate division Zixibacteria bacterium]
MTLIDRVNLFISLFVDTLHNIGRWRAWLVLLVYFAVNLLVLYVHRDFLSPMFYSLVNLWAHILDSTRAPYFSHYPQHFILLGDYYAWSKLIVGVLAEGIILGYVARSFGEVYLGSPKEPWQPKHKLSSRYLQFLIVWVVFNGLTVAAGMIVPDVFSPLIDGPRRALAFSFFIMPALFTILFAVFMFAIPMVAVRDMNAFQALGKSVLMFLRRPFTCFFLSVTILIVPLFLSALTAQPGVIIDKFRPELLYWLLVAGLVTEVAANFFWMGATVRYLAQPDE